MDIQAQQVGDVATLQQRIGHEKDAAQRDRYRAVVLAIAGEPTRAIQTKLDRSRAFVQRWAYAYRDGGIEAIQARQPPGAECKLTAPQQQAFRQRMLAGPTEADGVCALRGKDAQRILEQQFGQRYSLPGVYDLLHRLGLEPLRPRPRHVKNDPPAMQQWREDAPLFIQQLRDEHPQQAVEVWFQDEARVGQQGTLTGVWAERGSRPTVVKQTEYAWCYLFGAVNPQSGASSALLAPTVNTDYMNEHLRFISEEAGPDTHVVLVLDQAGWHVAKALRVPANITLLYLPSYSPELNPIERLWLYLKTHYLSNRVYADYHDLFAACRAAWQQLDPSRLKAITHTTWIMLEDQS